MNEEEESKSWIEKLRDREIGTELKENVVEGIKFGANWVGTKALELLPEEDQKWWNEVGWPHLQSEWEYKTNRSRNMTGPLNMTGLDAFALLTSPSWAPYALKGQILSHITRIDPDLTTIFGAGLRPKHLGISQKVTPYNPLQLKGSKPVDFNKGGQIINEIFDRPKFKPDPITGLIPKYAANAKIWLGDQPPASTFMTTTGGDGSLGQGQPNNPKIKNLQQLWGYVTDQIEGVRPVESDLPLSAAGDESAPLASWGVRDISGQEAVDLANVVYQGSIEPEQRLDGISRYKGGGKDVDFSKWAREEYTPLMEAAAKEQGMGLQPFFSLVASRPGFKYIEHRIAKREDLKWYWEMQGDPNVPWYVKANDISNLRLLLNDRFKQLKDAVEVQIYGGSKGTGGINQDIPNRANRYIVDIESPPTGRQYSSMDQNPGDIVIRKAGSNQEVGRIGEYYDVLWSSFDDLMKNPGFVLYFDGRYDVRYRGQHRPDWRGMSKAQLKDAIREWRNLIISDHLDIIRRKENDLVNLTPQQKLEKINIALMDDMTEFRDEFSNVLPFLTRGQWSQIHKDMTYEDILKLQQNTEYTPKPPTVETIDEVFSRPRFPTKRDTINKTIKGSSGLPGGG